MYKIVLSPCGLIPDRLDVVILVALLLVLFLITNKNYKI
tara:strand:- start:793 stop:909 length:117 start_codon:yes stop_codon:yes gene_type:complete